MNRPGQESLELIHGVHESPVQRTELEVHLGCTGCEYAIDVVTLAEAGQVISDIRSAGAPYLVRNRGQADWRRAGHASCVAAGQGESGCAFQEQITQAAEVIEAL